MYYNPIRDFIYQARVTADADDPGRVPNLPLSADRRAAERPGCAGTVSSAAALQLNGKASLLRARNLNAAEWLVMMPTDRAELEVSFLPSARPRFRDNSVSIAARYVARQTRVPDNSDFVAPPADYLLLRFEASTTLNLNRQKIVVGLGLVTCSTPSTAITSTGSGITPMPWDATSSCGCASACVHKSGNTNHRIIQLHETPSTLTIGAFSYSHYNPARRTTTKFLTRPSCKRIGSHHDAAHHLHRFGEHGRCTHRRVP